MKNVLIFAPTAPTSGITQYILNMLSVMDMFENYFSTDPLTQSESVAIGRALAKLPELKHLGKTVTTFRLFDGKNYDSEESNTPIKGKANSPPKKKTKGGRMK